jgi:hypothetical protein
MYLGKSKLQKKEASYKLFRLNAILSMIRHISSRAQKVIPKIPEYKLCR